MASNYHIDFEGDLSTVLASYQKKEIMYVCYNLL